MNPNLNSNLKQTNLLIDDINLKSDFIQNNNEINPYLKSNLNNEINQDIKLEQNQNNILNKNVNVLPDNNINLNDDVIFQNNIPNITNTNENKDKQINPNIDINFNQQNINNNLNNNFIQSSNEFYDKNSINQNDEFNFNNNSIKDNNNKINHYLPAANDENSPQNLIEDKKDYDDNNFNIFSQDEDRNKEINENSIKKSKISVPEENNNEKKNIYSKIVDVNIENEENNNIIPANKINTEIKNEQQIIENEENNNIRPANKIKTEIKNEQPIIENEENNNIRPSNKINSGIKNEQPIIENEENNNIMLSNKINSEIKNEQPIIENEENNNIMFSNKINSEIKNEQPIIENENNNIMFSNEINSEMKNEQPIIENENNNNFRASNNNDLNENQKISKDLNLNSNINIDQNNNENLNNNIFLSNNNNENSKKIMDFDFDNNQNNFQNNNNTEFINDPNKNENIDFKIDEIEQSNLEKKSINENPEDDKKHESININLGEDNEEINKNKNNILPPGEKESIKDDNDSVKYIENKNEIVDNQPTRQPKDFTDEMKTEIEICKSNYQNFLSKFDQRIIEKIDDTVEKIYTFDTDNPFIKDENSFFHINKFEDEEKKFSNLFNDYENLMKNEGENLRKKREKKFQTLQNFSGTIEQNDLLLKFISEYNPTHNDEMAKIEESSNLNILLPELNEELKNEIFNENELLNEFNSPIGNFENTETFIYKYSVHDNYRIMANAFKNFNYWRPSFSDGNSFYRIFMYCLFENYIISANKKELKKLICEIIKEEYITLYRNKGINIEHFLYILKEILFLVERNDIIEAYNLFNKAYRLKSHCFDYSLIFYLRNIVYYYTNEVMKLLIEYGENNNQNINKKELFNVNAILEFGIEPEFILICFMPYLYDISLKIFWVDGDFSKPKDGIINFLDEEDDQLPILTFGIFYSNFNILYSDKINDKLKKYIEKYNIGITQLTYIKEDIKYLCEICNKETIHILFIEKKFMVCKGCFTSYVNKILKNRAKYFEKDYYNGLEHYNKPIHLQNDYYIDNYEIIELYTTNINNILHDNLFQNKKEKCSSCNKNIDLNNKFEMSCHCKFCNDCFNQLLSDATKGKMFLNRYEREKYDKIDCKCGNKFDIDEALKLYKPKEEEVKKAEKRMIYYVQTLCCKCLKELAKYNEEKKSFQSNEKIIKVKIKKENDPDNKIEYFDGQHIICNNCFKKEKKVKFNINEGNNVNDNQNENDNNSDKEQKIKCNICNKVHLKIPNDDDNNDEGNCCAKCNIF